MERLINPNSGAIRFNDMNQMVAIIDKLRQYEDTGLTPEEIKELEIKYREDEHEYCGEYGTDECQFQHRLETLHADRDYWKTEAIKATAELGEIKIAEEQGLLIKLPCPIGTPVHRITQNPMWSYHRLEAEKRNEPKMIIYDTPFLHMYIPEFGKTVFLTKEEAEEALKGLRG